MKRTKDRLDFSPRLRAAVEAGILNVVTRCGCPARILCWDLRLAGRKRLLAAIKTGPTGDERVCAYDPETGLTDDPDTGWDLFFEQIVCERTPFEEQLAAIIEDFGGERPDDGNLEEAAEDLLSLAHGEIRQEILDLSRGPKQDEKPDNVSDLAWEVSRVINTLVEDYASGVGDELVKTLEKYNN